VGFGATPYWDDISSFNETCPSGYRRPNDGFTNAVEDGSTPARSEIRQSLYAIPQDADNPGNNNSFYGYYADGFFDRRKIVYHGTNHDAVSIQNSQIAYVGVLFYNTTDNRSLFFPSAGERWPTGANGGALIGSGGGADYWSSSSASDQSVNAPNAWSMYVSPGTGTAFQREHDKHSGINIRCVLTTNP
jgi:hypothetical protein